MIVYRLVMSDVYLLPHPQHKYYILQTLALHAGGYSV